MARKSMFTDIDERAGFDINRECEALERNGGA